METPTISCTRIFNDVDGISHMEAFEITFQEVNYAPPASPLNLSALTPATQYAFLIAPPGWDGDWHPSPIRQLVTILKGEFDIETADGNIKRVGPGDSVLAEDTSGRGHRTMEPEHQAVLALVVHLPS